MPETYKKLKFLLTCAPITVLPSNINTITGAECVMSAVGTPIQSWESLRGPPKRLRCPKAANIDLLSISDEGLVHVEVDILYVQKVVPHFI